MKIRQSTYTYAFFQTAVAALICSSRTKMIICAASVDLCFLPDYFKTCHSVIAVSHFQLYYGNPKILLTFSENNCIFRIRWVDRLGPSGNCQKYAQMKTSFQYHLAVLSIWCKLVNMKSTSKINMFVSLANCIRFKRFGRKNHTSHNNSL